jgi:hypothetical protein
MHTSILSVLSSDLPGFNPATLNGVILYYRLMTKWSCLGDSTELSRIGLSHLRMWLVYLQKITEHNEPCMPALMKASTYIIIHYRNGIHALSRCMDSVQPRTPSV